MNVRYVSTLATLSLGHSIFLLKCECFSLFTSCISSSLSSITSNVRYVASQTARPLHESLCVNPSRARDHSGMMMLANTTTFQTSFQTPKAASSDSSVRPATGTVHQYIIKPTGGLLQAVSVSQHAVRLDNASVALKIKCPLLKHFNLSRDAD